VAGYGIDHVDRVSVFGEPSRMYPGPASDVDDRERSAGQVRADHFLGPHEFQLPEPLGDAETFVDLFLIVLRDLFRKLFHRTDGTPPTTDAEHLERPPLAGVEMTERSKTARKRSLHLNEHLEPTRPTTIQHP